MKKLLCTALFLSSLILNAQDGWNTTVTDGFARGINFNFLRSFKGKLYTGGDSSHLLASRLVNTNSSPNSYANTSVLRVFSSADGVTFTENAGFFNIANNGNHISAVTSNNNVMFIGTSVKDTVKSPQVYRFDGTNYTMHDTIHYDKTGYNIAPGVGGASIGALALFSPGSVNDSIYAFVNSTNNYYASIYKSSVNNAHWVNVGRFSVGSGIIYINDAVVWHKRLYVSTNIDSLGGSYKLSTILSTADGSHWDTISHINPVLASAGVAGTNGHTFGKFEIHRDTLLVGINGSIPCSIPVWYTTDSSNIHPTWHGYIGTNPKDSAMAIKWSNGVSDLKSFGNKLWVTSNEFYQAVYSYNKHKGLRRSSQNAPLESGNNGSLLLESFNNNIYAAGTTVSAGTLVNGNLSRLGLPVANFTDTSTYGLCTSNLITFKSTSLNSTYCKWFQNDTLVGYGTPITRSFNNPGIYQIKILAYSTSDTTSLVDSLTRLLTIYSPPTVGSVTPSSYTICQGQPDTLHVTVTGGTAPYTYQWNAYYPGTGTFYGYPGIINLTSVTTSSPTLVNAQVTDAHGCVASGGGVYIHINQSDSLSGFVKTGLNSTAISKGAVYLFKQKSMHVGVGDSTNLYSLTGSPLPAGYFTFPNLYYGEYYLKAVADTSVNAYPLSVGTYYTNPINSNAYQWDSATVITHHGCTAANDTLSIKVIEIILQTGTGKISGIIVKDTTFGHRWANGGYNSVMGSPLKGIDVKLGKTPGGGCSGRTSSGSTPGKSPGYYEFNNVATGTYKIFVDIPNYGMDSVRLVHIDPTDSISVDNNYHVDSTKIYIDKSVTTGVFTQGKSNNTSVKVYPNPATNLAYLDFYNKDHTLVSAQLYDLAGKQIAVLANQKMQQGNQSIKINLAELQLPAGVYFIRVTINNSLQTFKLTLISN